MKVVEVGAVYVPYEPNRGVYMALRSHRLNRWECLVLVKDIWARDENVGTVTFINTNWLLRKCEKIT